MIKRISKYTFLLSLILVASSLGFSQDQEAISPIDTLPPYIRKLTNFGQRADWSLDGKKVLFIEKPFGDVMEVDIETGEIEHLTRHFFHEGFLRALYLANGDILLSGARVFDAKDPWKGRDSQNAELWVLKRDLTRPPVPLGTRCKEGPAASRTQMKIAWTIGPSIFVGDIEYDNNGIPKLRNFNVAFQSKDLPSKVRGWDLETQNFRPYNEDELIFLTHGVYESYEAEVMSFNLKTKKFTNYSKRIDRYDEPEGPFPDGLSIVAESNRHRPSYNGMKGFMTLDIYKLPLDETGEMERLTYFNHNPNYKASNPVVSPDGKYMAFQWAKTVEAAGMGRGILLFDFEAYEEFKKQKQN